MFRKKIKKEDGNLNYTELNSSIKLLKEILKITYILFIILAIYVITVIFEKWHIASTLGVFLKTISPLFVGLFLAWLFDPIVSFFEKKGMKRVISALLTYVLFIGAILLLIGSIIPVLSDQMSDFVKMVPNVFDTVKDWASNILEKFNNGSIDVEGVKNGLFKAMEGFGTDLTSTMPDKLVGIAKGLFSGVGIFLVGIIIGFYLSVGFKNVTESVVTLLPRKMRDDARELLNAINGTCRSFIKGAIIDSTVIFVISSLAFILFGLKAPLLFGLFCGITNVIPYVGPYIGGAPAVIVAFSQGTTIGIFILISIIIIQAIEGNFLQALIMSKSTKLHPVTIIIGLLAFGYFFGVIGMVISTPILGAIKAILVFFNNKYDILANLKQ